MNCQRMLTVLFFTGLALGVSEGTTACGNGIIYTLIDKIYPQETLGKINLNLTAIPSSLNDLGDSLDTAVQTIEKVKTASEFENSNVDTINFLQYQDSAFEKLKAIPAKARELCTSKGGHLIDAA